MFCLVIFNDIIILFIAIIKVIPRIAIVKHFAFINFNYYYFFIIKIIIDQILVITIIIEGFIIITIIFIN